MQSRLALDLINLVADDRRLEVSIPDTAIGS